MYTCLNHKRLRRYSLNASLVLVVILSASCQSTAKSSPPCIPNSGQCVPPDDVAIGEPLFTPYSRIFPLMAGLLQDFGAMQVNPLLVNANAANASHLDAVIQQFALSVQYSQTQGMQNSLAASQFATAQQTNQQQSLLLAQQTQWLGIQSAAQQELLAAQNAEAAIPDSSTAEKDAAKLRVAQANNSVNAATSQLAVLKSSLPGATSTQTFSPIYSGTTSPAVPAVPDTRLPPATSPATTADGKSISPTFAPLKQIQNQTALLWERLVQMVRLLSEDEQRDGESIYLVEFHTGPLSGGAKRKHQLLTTEYKLSCGANAPRQPRVIDLYPRTAAVNIADEKYKDNRFGVAAIVSFFSLGVNAAYNREHLQITQALNESAYITGFGIQRSSFGWVFGPALGESAVTSGDRETFALIAVPRDCNGTREAKLGLVNAVWSKEASANPPTGDDVPLKGIYRWCLPPYPPQPHKPPPEPDKTKPGPLESVSYSPAEVDLTATPQVKPSVTINLVLGEDSRIDSQANLIVNGYMLKRARDNFLRGTAPASSGSGEVAGAGGFLESTSVGDNTWLPVSQKELSVRLNAAEFTGQFPSLRLDSPTGSMNLTDMITAGPEAKPGTEEKPGTKLSIGGRDVTCPAPDQRPCAQTLPPLGRPKASNRPILVSRWDHRLLLQVDAPSPQVAAQSNTTAPVQVITSSTKQLWSNEARVLAVQKENATYLDCTAKGERLVCKTKGTKICLDKRLRIEVNDPMYNEISVGGPKAVNDPIYTRTSVVGTIAVNHTPEAAYVWSLSDPKWSDLSDLPPTPPPAGRDKQMGWRLKLRLIEVENDDKITLGDLPEVTVTCKTPDEPCDATVSIPVASFDKVRDSMKLTVINGATRGRTIADEIINIRTLISPVLTYISDDKTQFTGKNLVFDQMSIGPEGTKRKLVCAGESDCFVSGSPTSEQGYLYFRTKNGAPIPFMKSEAGSLSVVAAHPSVTTKHNLLEGRRVDPVAPPSPPVTVQQGLADVPAQHATALY